MKYAHLVQIAEYLGKFKKISSVLRVSDMALKIEFSGGERLFFDLSKADSAIYKNENFTQAKIYQAPCDNVLKKRLNGAYIQSVECLKNNRILKFTCAQTGSYKSVKTHLYLEFTGRFTNAVITDEAEVIVEALRHVDNSYRKIETGEVLAPLEAFEIREKPVAPIENFDDFFKSEFLRLNERNLASLREVKLARIYKKIEALKQNLAALESEASLTAQSENLALQASVLLANLSEVKEHERNFTLTGFNGERIKYELALPPKIAANEFYSRSKRLRAKAAGVGAERENLNEKIKFYENLAALVTDAKSAEELEILVPKKSRAKANERKEKQSLNTQNFFAGEYKISVGRNEKGNAELLKNARKDDVWMHVKDLPGAHVIIKTLKAKVPEETLKFAAKICVNFSSLGAGNYEVDFTKRNNVKILSGANVNYTDFGTIIVTKE
ncbi:NFACT RNA binding domain-containing protein [uncultured Campylobacter sp.]|jgi:fibronectin/fibrinogen-binding protein|uniref:NFACT RNA binding domain-containing protein n=1 Tax=uncultured Campylobacter sp. TaxID=218934 RepID=UPI0025EBC063|nr:NFACT RNA binding domain-containing protein [uncultured Campylobacter sp.]